MTKNPCPLKATVMTDSADSKNGSKSLRKQSKQNPSKTLGQLNQGVAEAGAFAQGETVWGSRKHRLGL